MRLLLAMDAKWIRTIFHIVFDCFVPLFGFERIGVARHRRIGSADLWGHPALQTIMKDADVSKQVSDIMASLRQICGAVVRFILLGGPVDQTKLQMS